MEVKRMRTCVGGNRKFVKKVFKKQNGVLVPVYDFTKLAMVDDVLEEGFNRKKQGYLGNIEIYDTTTEFIYETDSIENDSYEYKGFEIEYEITGSNGIIVIVHSSGSEYIYPETMSGKFAGGLIKGEMKLSIDESFNATYIKIINSSTDETMGSDVAFTIKKLTFIK